MPLKSITFNVFPNLQNIPSPIFYLFGKGGERQIFERGIGDNSIVSSINTNQAISESISDNASSYSLIASIITIDGIVRTVSDSAFSSSLISSATVTGEFQQNEIEEPMQQNCVISSAIKYTEINETISDNVGSYSLISSATA